MKKILICAILVSSLAHCQAATIMWNEKQKPSVSLNQAVVMAEKALHRRAKDFYCLGGGIINASWELRFGSKSGEMRFVTVSMNKKVWVSKAPPTHY
jgi:hypothetical protein